jgi:hypothetical protein
MCVLQVIDRSLALNAAAYLIYAIWNLRNAMNAMGPPITFASVFGSGNNERRSLGYQEGNIGLNQCKVTRGSKVV